MIKNFKLSILFSIILIGLIAIIVVMEPLRQKKIDADLGKLEIFSFDPKSLDSITLRNQNFSGLLHQRIVLTRLAADPSKWELTDPFRYPADAAMMDYLLLTLPRLQAVSWVKESKSLGEFGLDRPYIELILTGKDFSHTLQIGRRSATSHAFYARRIDSESIYLVDGALFTNLFGSLSEYRDKTLFPFDPAHLESLEVRAKKIHWLLKKDAHDKWMVMQNEQARVPNPQKVQRLLRGLQRTRIQAFEGDLIDEKSLKQFDLDPAEWKITLKSNNLESELNLIVSRSHDLKESGQSGSSGPLRQVFAMRVGEPFVLRLTDDFLAGLRSPEDLELKKD